jgi:hypothetical protein
VMRMMRFAIAFGIAWGMQSGVSFAEADWLDRLSGPGPHWGVFADYRFGCFSSPALPATTGTAFTFLKPWDRTAFPWFAINPAPQVQPNPRDPKAVAAYNCKRDVLHDYLIVSYRFDQSYSNEVVPRNSDGDKALVRINGFEVGHVHRLKPGLALRDTVGMNRFSGKQFTTFWKESNTIALELAPYAVSVNPADDVQVSRAYRVKVIFGATILYGDFEASAFCNRTDTNPQCTRVSPHHYGVEVIPKFSFVIDRALW